MPTEIMNIVRVNAAELDPTCECGADAYPGVFSIQMLGNGQTERARRALEPIALCVDCVAVATEPSEFELGVVVIQIVQD